MSNITNNHTTGSKNAQSIDRSLLEFLKPKPEERYSKLEAYCDLLSRAATSAYTSKTGGRQIELLPGQFVIHLRSFQGGFAHSAYEGITSPAYTVMDFKEKELHDDMYWKYVFMTKMFIIRLETVTYGIRDGRSISFADYSSLEMKYPDVREQAAIGQYFQTLDKQLRLYEQKLSKLKNLKSAFLKNMFV